MKKMFLCNLACKYRQHIASWDVGALCSLTHDYESKHPRIPINENVVPSPDGLQEDNDKEDEEDDGEDDREAFKGADKDVDDIVCYEDEDGNQFFCDHLCGQGQCNVLTNDIQLGIQ